MTTETFAEFVDRRFGGVLTHGGHTPDGAACFHEAVNVYLGRDWSDDTTGTLDLTALNDAPWSSDAVRTTAMLPLGVIVLGWPDWTPERRQAWAKIVAEQTASAATSALRGAWSCLPRHRGLAAAALRCETEGTWAVSISASAEWARSSARSADVPLIAICRIMTEAAT